MIGSHVSPPDTLDALRERVLRAGVAVLAVGMPLVAALVVWQGAQEHQLNFRTFAICGAMVCFPLLWLVTPRLKFRTAAGIFVALLILTAFVLASRGVLSVAMPPSICSPSSRPRCSSDAPAPSPACAR
jgi:ABC-type amino acid transport system permease subunit